MNSGEDNAANPQATSNRFAPQGTGMLLVAEAALPLDHPAAPGVLAPVKHNMQGFTLCSLAGPCQCSFRGALAGSISARRTSGPRGR